MRQRRRGTLRVIVVIVLLAMAGCASQWSYRLLDWYVSGQLRDYLPLNSVQRADFEQRLETLLRWHQGTQLPLYSDWLRTLDELAAADRITPEQWRTQGERAGEFWQLLMRRVQPHAAAILAQLSDEQVAEFLDNIERRTAELEQEYQGRDTQERRQHRARRMEKTAKRWLGSLNQAQSARIEQWSAAVEDLSELSIASRRRWTATMARALAPAGSGEPAMPLVRQLEPLLVEPSRLWTPAYSAAIERNTSQTISLLSDLHAMCDAEQRRHLHDALRSWSDRLDRLAAA